MGGDRGQSRSEIARPANAQRFETIQYPKNTVAFDFIGFGDSPKNPVASEKRVAIRFREGESKGVWH